VIDVDDATLSSTSGADAAASMIFSGKHLVVREVTLRI